MLTAQVEFGVFVRWYLNGNFLLEGPAQIAAYAPGIYTANCWNGCGQADALNALTVMVLPAPSQPTITQNQQLLQSVSTGDLQWLDNLQQPLSGQINQSFQPSQSGVYYVQLTGDNGCTSVSEPFNFLMTGLEDIQESYFNVYPSPASDEISFRCSRSGITESVFKVFSADGKLVSGYIVPADDNAIQVDISSFPAGIYFVTNGKQTRRFTVIR
jgi:hypothetical protein